mmetsp:Transcript_5463/g.16286  ORF Transcript_5463/g.16286 Transcript_5463/m.16286 type:complete len:387 (-) Transcript_5463:1241-2401(-)
MDVDELRENVRQLATCAEDVKAVLPDVASLNTAEFDVIVDNVVQSSEDAIEQYEETSALSLEVRKRIESTEEALRECVVTRKRLTEKIDNVLERYASEEDRRKSASTTMLLRHLLSRSGSELNDLRAEVEAREKQLAAVESSLAREEDKVAVLRSQLVKDRRSREEDLRHSQKWRQEVGLRLKTTTGQLIGLRKERAKLVDAFELKAEDKADWQDRGEAAQREITELRQRAEAAEEAVVKLEGLRKERAELAESLSAEGRQAENTVPFVERYSSDASFNSRLVRGLQSRLKTVTENARELGSSLKETSRDIAVLSEEVANLAAEKNALQSKLEKQQRVSNARESVLMDGNVLARSMNGAISRWILDARIDLPFSDQPPSRRSASRS